VEGRESPVGVLGADDEVTSLSLDPHLRVIRRVTAVVVATLALSGCRHAGAPPDSSSPGPSAGTVTVSPQTAQPAPAPVAGSCYQLDHDQALAPTTEVEPVPCDEPHTSMAYYAGRLQAVVDGHLLAVDSRRVQAQVAADCRRRFGTFVGGSPRQLRLTVLRPVWFSPTLDQSDKGQDWFRCDAIALAADDQLAQLPGALKGALATPAGRRAYGICADAPPSEPGAERVSCSRPHTWRAIASYDLAAARYPGENAVRTTGQAPCKQAARAIARDKLSYRWGLDWPTAQQFGAGQRYGLCWAPD
jgi:hypothetical protein